MTMRTALCIGFVAAFAGLFVAAAKDTSITVDPPAKGAVTFDDGLLAWGRIYKVVSHPRCSNCHVGKDNIPMWSGPSYGTTRRHGMNINAGESRIGAEAVLCSTCHTTSAAGNDTPHAAPRVNLPWHLAPVEFEWFGKSAPQICAQLRDPKRNGGRSALALAEHLRDDSHHGGFVQWGWNPGGGRDPVPFTLQDHVNDVLAWGAAGMPCPTE
jgi:hypothetical protein